MSYQVINSKVIIDALPETMRFRGVWTDKTYVPNEVVTYQGQTFIALSETASIPGSDGGWAQLADKPEASDLVGQVAVVNGGTGASTAADARVNLGLEIGVNVQAYNADAATRTYVTGITNPLAGRVSTAESDISDIESAATALTTRVSSAESAATALTGRVSTAESDINAIESAATALEGRVTDAEAELVSQDGRLDALEGTSSALGSIAQQNSNNVTITGGTIVVSSLESTGSLTVGSSAQIGGALNMSGQTINNLGAPTLTGDATTKEYVDQKVADLVDSAPELLNTLKELADAITADESAATTLATQVGGLDTRLTQAEADIQTVSGNTDNNASSINVLGGTVNNDIAPRLSTLETTVNDSVVPQLSSAQTDITNLANNVAGLYSTYADPAFLSSQRADSVEITGGSINGVVIGNGTPADATFSSVTVQNNLIVSGASTFSGNISANVVSATTGSFGAVSGTTYSEYGTLVTAYAATNVNIVEGTGVYLVDANGADMTLNLPSAATYNLIKFTVKKVDSTDHMIEVVAVAGETIDGESSKFIPYAHQSVTFYSYAGNWHCI